MAYATTGPPAPAPEIAVGDPDQAWKALGLVNDWIKHAEAKTGAALALAGVVGGVLYNLVKDQQHPSTGLRLAALICGVSVLVAGASAALALVPRLRLSRLQDEPVNTLFFSHVARAYANDSPAYIEVFCTLTGQPKELTRQIAHQVHANAVIAHRKFVWSNLALRALVVALAALGAVAAIVGSE